MKIAVIIQELPKLTKIELSTLKAAIEHLQDSSSKHKIDDETEELLFQTMLATLGVHGVSYDKFVKIDSYKSWLSALPVMRQFMAKVFKATGVATSRKTQRVALARLLWGILKADFEGRGVPVSIRTLSMNLGQLPNMFEQAFPGYLSSGLAHTVLTAMVRGGTKHE